MDALDVQKGYEIGMNREPESDAVINAWVGKPYKELANSFGGSIEWQRNHAHVLDYDRLAKENADLKAQLAAKPNGGGLTSDQATSLSRIDSSVQWIKDLLSNIFKN